MSWNECKEQVLGFKGAVYKSFSTHDEAIEYLGMSNKITKPKKEEVAKISNVDSLNFTMEKDKLYAFVDGSYNGVTGTVGYGLVLVKNNTVQFKDLGSFRNINFNKSKNIFGELRGALKSVELAIANDFKDICIVYDYIGISKLATGEYKASTDVTRDYQNAMNRYKHLINITFQKVKAHTSESEGGSKFNAIADELARIATKL